MTHQIRFEFSQGSLIAPYIPNDANTDGFWLYDERTLQYRAKAYHYKKIIESWTKNKVPFEDTTRIFPEKIDTTLMQALIPRVHQKEALDAWIKDEYTGVMSLPTGAGKTILAVLAIAQLGCSTLVIVPTLDLVSQWKLILSRFFGISIGSYGGGVKDLQDLMVSTYDSAHLFMPYYGHRWKLLIVDECHHLGGPLYQSIARCSTAIYRMGLSATVERMDGRESEIYELLGPKVYDAKITDLVHNTLAPYQVIQIRVQLSLEERRLYEEHRRIYTQFLKKEGIVFSDSRDWMRFVFASTQSPGGHQAMQSYRLQKSLSQASEAKFQAVWKLLSQHKNESILIFTDSNDMAYKIGMRFILPVLTHKTKAKERERMLEAFREHILTVLVTSKVLNEGVDVPEASVGIIVSGSGTVREHVQRLGRILRQQHNKQAVLYEVISSDTAEEHVNERRRQHHAYEKSSQM